MGIVSELLQALEVLNGDKICLCNVYKVDGTGP